MSEGGHNRFGAVRNPLTVIAVFAGIAELTATIALPQLDREVQSIFVWFVMLFPTLLVCLFFFVLWKRHHVLYAPSDFSDEKNFMRHWGPAPSHGVEVEDEGGLVEKGDLEEEVNQQSDARTPTAQIGAADYQEFRRSTQLAERLVISNLEKKYGLSFATDVALNQEVGFRYDAVAMAHGGPVMVEVKLLRHPANALMLLRRELDRAASLTYKLPAEEIRNVRLVLAYVFETDAQLVEASRVRTRMRELRDAANLPLTVELEFFTLENLRKGEG